MGLTNEAFNAVDRYFKVLSHTGYKSQNEVNKLMVFLFIEEILNGPMSEFITPEDKSIIDNSLNCLYGSCMIPFPNTGNEGNDKVLKAKKCCCC